MLSGATSITMESLGVSQTYFVADEMEANIHGSLDEFCLVATVDLKKLLFGYNPDLRAGADGDANA